MHRWKKILQPVEAQYGAPLWKRYLWGKHRKESLYTATAEVAIRLTLVVRILFREWAAAL